MQQALEIMVAKIALVLLVAVAVSANPAANDPWHWVPARLTVTPNHLAVPFEEAVKKVFRPRPKFTTETVTVENCGQAPLAPQASPAIVGGIEAPPHAFPWQVGLFIDGMIFCGGSIISDEWVMTAAHCMQGTKFVDVVAGAQDITINEPTQVTIRSTDHIVNEDWNPIIARNDIAVIKLPQKLTFNDYIQPVCLPKKSEGDLPAGTMVTATGWGKTQDGPGSISNVLNEVTDPTITTDACAQTYGFLITDNQICFDTTGGKGACNGDSGGPLNYKVNGITETRGIASFVSSAGCESGDPDAYTRVSHYLDWIQTNTGVTSPQ